MSLPIDEGAPTFTAATIAGAITTYITQITGGNFCTAIRPFFRNNAHNVVTGTKHANFGEHDIPFWCNPGTEIHNVTQLDTENLTQEAINAFLHLQNPLSYHDTTPSLAIRDFLFHQAHIGQDSARLLPIGDYGPNLWSSSAGFPHWPLVADQSTATFLYTTGNPAASEVFTLSPLPPGAGTVNECVVNLFGALRAQTDVGLAFKVMLFDVNDVQLSTTKYIDSIPTDEYMRFGTARFERVNGTPHHIEIATTNMTSDGVAFRFPLWTLFYVDVIAFYDSPSNTALDWQRFGDLSSGEATLRLDFDLIDGTMRDALLDIASHSPDLGIYLDYKSTLTAARVGAYADTPIRFALTPNGTLRSIRRRWIYNERFATRVTVKWGVQVSNTIEANQEKDPINEPATRGSRKSTYSLNYPETYKAHIEKTLDRHFFRLSSSYAQECAERYLAMYGKGVGTEAIEAVCELAACEVEPMDVVSVDYPDLGFAARPFLCVSKSIDDDDETVTLILYDIERTAAIQSPTMPDAMLFPAWAGFDSGGMLGVR